MTAMNTTAKLDAALEHAEHGVPIFQVWHADGDRCGCRAYDCANPGKHPISSTAPHGFKNATTDPDVIRWWYARFQLANIAEATGHYSDVLDVDPAKGGRESLARLEAQHGPLPVTPKVLTGGDGEHYRFLPVPGLRCSAGVVGPGLDIRAEDGYALLSPSSHVSGGTYRDDPDAPMYETPLAAPPEWLVALAMKGAPSSNGDGPRPTPDEWAQRLAGAPEGQRRAVALAIAGHYLGLRIAPEEVETILAGYAARCSPPFPDREARGLVRDLARRDRAKDRRTAPPADAADSSAGWPQPGVVDGGLLPVPAFAARRLLPTAFVRWVEDIAERAQCPIDFVAVAAVVAAGAVVGRRVAMRPKQQDDWAVVANLWGLVIGPPGIMKTPAVSEALRPLQRLAAEARETYEAQLAAHRFQEQKTKAQRELLQGRLKEALKRGDDTASLEAEFTALERVPPTERRFLVNDATVEKLGELLNENPHGLLLHRDELSGFLRTMDRDGHENDRAFYCEAWNGTGSYTYDRIGRGTVRIPAACVSLLGGLQPGPLVAYLREAFGHGKNDDGLIQRAQLAVWPDRAAEWRNVDRWPDTEAKTAAFEVFRRLATLDAREVGAHCDGALPFLRFTPEAQKAFDAWRGRLELQLRGDAEHPVLISHLAKYRSLMPSLALLFHLVDAGAGPVDVAAAQRAADWCTYLEPHARRLYQSVTAGPQVAAVHLAAKIQAGELTSPFRARTVQRKGWLGLSEPDEVAGGLDQLEERHWVRRVERPATVRGGRPTVEYEISPRVLNGSVGSVSDSGWVCGGSRVGPRACHVDQNPPPPPPPEHPQPVHTQDDHLTKPTKPPACDSDDEVSL